MPITLIVASPEHAGEGETPKLTFDGPRIVIGRSAGCDVRLPDRSVSQRHASIRADRAEYALVDEGSTNGTFVGGVRLTPHAARTLRSGDRIRVGRVWLEVRLDHSPPTPELAIATRELALRLVSRAMRVLGENADPKARVVEGHDLGAVLTLGDEGRLYTVGRGPECDLVLNDPDVSREHVQVTRRGGMVFVRDAGSKNGSRLGDTKLVPERDQPWRSLAMLQLGHTVLALDEPAIALLLELEQASDEPLAADEAAAPKRPDEVPAAAPTTQPDGPGEPGRAPPHPVTLRMRTKRPSLAPVDLAVLVTALAVIALSVAGLVWLFRG